MKPQSHCLMCDRPDCADNLVQCDKCDGYVHFSCAEVGDSIADADRSFTCRRCVESDAASSISSHRSSRRFRTMSDYSLGATRVRLRLEQLETDRQNRLKELEDTERFQRLRRQVDADIDKQRFEVLEAQLLEEEEHRSVRSEVSSRIIRENTSQWIGAASQTEGQVVTTSATAASTLTHTDVAVRIQNGDQSRSGGNIQTSSAVTQTEESFQPEDMVTRSEATFVMEPVEAEMLLPLSRRKQVRIESHSLKLPSLRQMQNPASDLPSSMEQLNLEQRIRWDESVLQPSGYESFVGNLTIPASRATNEGGATSTVQPPVVDRIQQSDNPMDSTQGRLLGMRQTQYSKPISPELQQYPVAPGMDQQYPIPALSGCVSPLEHQQFPELTSPFLVPQAVHQRISVLPSGHQPFPVPMSLGLQQFAVPQAVQQVPVPASSDHMQQTAHQQFLVPPSLHQECPTRHQQFPVQMSLGHQQFSVPKAVQQVPVPALSDHVQQTAHQQYSVPSSEHHQYPVPTLSVPVPQWGYQQIPRPLSPVFVLSSGPQQYYMRKPVQPEPLSGPGQSFAAANERVRPVTVQQHIPDPGRSRTTGPTAEQLAARQVISRELPAFSGDPQDWPLFFSAFRNSTEACGYNDAENLARLQRCLRGSALESVRNRLLIPESVPYVVNTLQRLYGRPEVIIMSLLKRMRETPSPKGDDLKTLIKFGMGVESLVDHMVLADQQQHISNPMLLQELVDRLPPNLKLQWASYKRSYQVVDLATFNAFMKELVEMASDVTPFLDLETQSKREKSAKEKLFVHQQESVVPGLDESSTASDETSVPVNKSCLHCDKPDHRVAECPDFKKLTMDERWKVMRQKGLCRLCLIPHRSWPCRSKQECGIGDCHMRHHPLMHSEKPDTNTQTLSTATNQNVAHQHHHIPTPSTLLRYIPVTLYGNGRSVEVYAFLDDGSTSTMLEAEVANLLGVVGPSEPLCLCWTGDVKRMEKESQRIEITISGRDKEVSFPLRARTVEQLKLPSQTVAYDKLCNDHPHLRKLPLCSYADVTPRLIIGVDNAKLISALESRESSSGELVASKTRLGWCIYGRCTTERNPIEYVNAHAEQCEKEAVQLNNEVEHGRSKDGLEMRNYSSNSTAMHECAGETSEVQRKSLTFEAIWTTGNSGETLKGRHHQGSPIMETETREPHQFGNHGDIRSTSTVDERRNVILNVIRKTRLEKLSLAKCSWPWTALRLHRDITPEQLLRMRSKVHPTLVDENQSNRCPRSHILNVVPETEGRMREAVVRTSKDAVCRATKKLALLDATTVGDPEEDCSSEPELHGWEYVGEPTVSSPPIVK